MIRLLILLFTLNTLFPAGYAMSCASGMEMNSMVVTPVASAVNYTATQAQASTPGKDQPLPMQAAMSSHCDDPAMDCCDKMDTSQHSDCDAGCNMGCVSLSVTMTHFLPELVAHAASVKPVSGYTAFYSRSISPELQPPLV